VEQNKKVLLIKEDEVAKPVSSTGRRRKREPESVDGMQMFKNYVENLQRTQEIYALKPKESVA
jgi:hypothetical protein